MEKHIKENLKTYFVSAKFWRGAPRLQSWEERQPNINQILIAQALPAKKGMAAWAIFCFQVKPLLE